MRPQMAHTAWVDRVGVPGAGLAIRATTGLIGRATRQVLRGGSLRLGRQQSSPSPLTVGKGQRLVLGTILPLAATISEQSQPLQWVAERLALRVPLWSRHMRGLDLRARHS